MAVEEEGEKEAVLKLNNNPLADRHVKVGAAPFFENVPSPLPF